MASGYLDPQGKRKVASIRQPYLTSQQKSKLSLEYRRYFCQDMTLIVSQEPVDGNLQSKHKTTELKLNIIAPAFTYTAGMCRPPRPSCCGSTRSGGSCHHPAPQTRNPKHGGAEGSARHRCPVNLPSPQCLALESVILGKNSGQVNKKFCVWNSEKHKGFKSFLSFVS